MDVVLLAVCSAALFGAMTVALRFALGRGADPDVGALVTAAIALLVALPFALAEGFDPSEVWPFALTGLLAPGLAQVLFAFAVRDAGPSRTSVTVGTAPLFAVAIALVFLDEPLRLALVAGALLVVVGGTLLVRERGRPEHVKGVGLVLALLATIAVAARDNVVRWLAVDVDAASPGAAAAVSLAAGVAVAALWVRAGRRPLRARHVRDFALTGLLLGVSYVALFEAYYRGRVSVVSPLVATESLWGVGLSALFLGRHELVGPRLAGGAALVVAGGALIGVAR